MQFTTPRGELPFEIPDEWWAFAEMSRFTLNGARFYAWDPDRYPTAKAVPITEIEPPQRSAGLDPFKKYKLVPILFAFRSPEGVLPPVEVRPSSSGYGFQLVNGAHRYYASAAVRFPFLPIVVG